jgi:hypothetical protein
MSTITMRSTKAQMLAEIERLRERCESLEAALCAASQPERSLEPSERRSKLEAMKALATKFRCSVRIRDGVIELYSKQQGCWVAASEEAQP